MTEDFARDMQLLKDLLDLATKKGEDCNPAFNDLKDLRDELHSRAHDLMEAVTHLKRAFNTQNRELMMGFWIAGFEDPVDPYKVVPEVDDFATEDDLLARARFAGNQLIELMDLIKRPHVEYYDTQAGETAVGIINSVRELPLVDAELKNGYKWLGNRLDSLTSMFPGGAGGQSTYWPSNYVSSSSSSSSSSSFP